MWFIGGMLVGAAVAVVLIWIRVITTKTHF